MDALRESEQRYARLLDSVSDYVYTVRVEEGRAVATWHGPGCREVTGYAPEDFAADSALWWRIIHPDDRKAVVDEVQRIDGAVGPLTIEHRMIRRDGAERWVRNKRVPRRDNAGRLIAYDGLISDVTGRKAAADKLRTTNAELRRVFDDLTRSHEELKAAQMQLIQAEKLQIIGRLAAGVAHEVKNPLAIIAMGLGVIEHPEGVSAAEIATVIARLKEAVSRADLIISGLLDFAAPSELILRRTDLNDVIHSSLKMVKHEITRSKVRLAKQLDPNLPLCMLDRPKIEQVFVNIFTNACHAMPNGGTLSITSTRRNIEAAAADREEGDRSGVRFRAGDEVAVVEVRDTGSGIPPDQLGKIFEPFFTTKPAGKGTGLGLTVTKKIIDLHGGRIDIGNAPGAGAAVRLVFAAVSHEHEKNPDSGR